MNKKITISPRWYGPVPTRNGKPLPKNQWVRAGRKRKWTVRWYAPDGSRPRHTFDKLAEAEAFAESRGHDFAELGPQARKRPKVITVGAFRDEFLQLRIGPKGQRMSVGTLAAYKPALDGFVEFVGENVRLIDIAPPDVTRFVARVRSRGLSVSTVNKYIASLSAAFNTAVTQLGYLHLNPCRTTKKNKVADQDKRYITPTEYALLLQTCRDRADMWWEAFIAVCYTAGTRLNEAAHLTWQDIDFENETIRIVAKPETAGLEAWRPKDYEPRTVPIPSTTIDTLSRLHTEAAEGSRFVFLSPERVSWIHAKREAGTWTEGQQVLNNTDRDFKRLAKAAGVQDVSLHDLRRGCITHWARRLPAHVVQELAGHSDIKTTLTFYVSIQADDLAKARAATAEALLLDPK